MRHTNTVQAVVQSEIVGGGRFRGCWLLIPISAHQLKTDAEKHVRAFSVRISKRLVCMGAKPDARKQLNALKLG